MSVVRKALAQYLNTVRDFSLEIASVDSGLFDVDAPSAVLQEPRVWFQLETDWIGVLLNGLETIQQYVDAVNQWVNHIRGLLQNLQVTEAEFLQITADPSRTVTVLQTKTYDEKYVRWVLEDVSQEIDRLFIATRQLLDEAPHLVAVTDQIKGPFMENVKIIAQTWTSRNLSELSARLIDVLKAASTSTNLPDRLQHIGAYCEMILMILNSTPLFVEDVSARRSSSQIFQENSRNIEKLIDTTRDFREFVRLRSIAYQRFFDHVQVLLQAVLPSVDAVTPWISHFVTDLSTQAEDLLPREIPIETLPLAFIQAEDAQNDWVDISKKLIPLRQRALSLNEVIQSPIINKFLTADQRRREITKTWLSRMMAAYQTLRKAVQNLSSAT